MLTPSVEAPRLAAGARQAFAIVASRYNAAYVQGLLDHATAEFTRLAAGARLSVREVPGAFEIPLVVQELAWRHGDELDAILALGVIMQGGTDHAEQIARAVTDSLQRVALERRIPVIHQVLSCKDEQQARIRCLEPEFNRGTEAAQAAIDMANLMTQLRAG